MAKVYNWKVTTHFTGTIDPNTLLTYGLFPPGQEDWQTTEVGEDPSGGILKNYYFHDANVSVGGYYTDANASRVVFSITQVWHTSIDYRNYLTVNVSSTINSVIRDNALGLNTDTPGRRITFYQQQGGPVLLELTDYQVATNHTILGTPVALESYSFTLAPGENLERSALFIHNQSIGYPSYDEVLVGVQFRNPLPKDYRPGATLDTNTSIWKSHNRTNGACHILSNTSNMTWTECRTVNGDSGGQGNPPLILTAANANSWYNQKKLGKE